jgi:ABC-2 type transport system ATP-binding protein
MTTSAGPTAALVIAESLQVVYQRGATPAIDGIDLTVGPGDGLLVAGEPGSGKSTLLRAIVGLVRFGGALAVLGGYPGTHAVARRVGWGPQGKGFADAQSPRSLVRMVAQLRGATPDVLDGAVADALQVAGIDGTIAGRVSTDVELLRRTSLACAVVGDPQLVVLDDPWEFEETVTAVNSIRARGGAVVAASHDPGGFPALLGRTVTLVEGQAA